MKVVTVEIVVPDEIDVLLAEDVVLNMLSNVREVYAIGSWQVVAVEDDFSNDAKGYGARVEDPA